MGVARDEVPAALLERLEWSGPTAAADVLALCGFRAGPSSAILTAFLFFPV